jgi:hypothetical protein
VLAKSGNAVSLVCTPAALVSYCTIVVALAAPPVQAVADGKEVLEAYATTTSSEPVSLLVRVRVGSNPAKVFATKTKGDRLIVTGDLVLSDDGNEAILYARVTCNATEEQFLNEVLVVGRLSSTAKVTESAKSCSRSVAVNRRVNGNDLTDWYRVRGYGYSMEKLKEMPKGALVSVSGTLEQRTNRQGDPYLEIKARNLRVHSKPKSGPDLAAGTTATGYSHADFTGESDMPHDWN